MAIGRLKMTTRSPNQKYKLKIAKKDIDVQK